MKKKYIQRHRIKQEELCRRYVKTVEARKESRTGRLRHQRYKCKGSGNNFTITKRKYSLEFKLKIIRMYLEGMGIKSIERIGKVSNQLGSARLSKPE